MRDAVISPLAEYRGRGNEQHFDRVEIDTQMDALRQAEIGSSPARCGPRMDVRRSYETARAVPLLSVVPFTDAAPAMRPRPFELRLPFRAPPHQIAPGMSRR
jgi:hypothetical protein